MSLKSYAESELDRVLGSDEYDQEIRKSVLEIIEIFEEQGHIGFSASYAISALTKLMKFEPLTPLTGEDSEWNEVGNGVFQNRRLSRVFKNASDNRAYDIDGIVFYEWMEDEDGRKFKSYYTCKDSKVFIEFPYEPKTIYIERPTES